MIPLHVPYSLYAPELYIANRETIARSCDCYWWGGDSVISYKKVVHENGGQNESIGNEL